MLGQEPIARLRRVLVKKKRDQLIRTWVRNANETLVPPHGRSFGRQKSPGNHRHPALRVTSVEQKETVKKSHLKNKTAVDLEPGYKLKKKKTPE